jgi:hypothetical protein
MDVQATEMLTLALPDFFLADASRIAVESNVSFSPR